MIKKILLVALIVGATCAIGYSAPTVSHDETTPANTESISNGDDRIREFKTQTREIMDVDHKWDSSGSGSTWGYHNSLHIIGASDLGTGSSSAVLLGGQADGSDTELTYTDANDSDVQITKDGFLNATALKGAIGGNGTDTGDFTRMTATYIDLSDTFNVGDSTTISQVLDDDSLTADSDTSLATQQSIKAYVDAISTPSSPGYDSGWIDLSGHSDDTEYTLTHSLGGMPTTIEVYWSDSNPGTYIYPVSVNDHEDASAYGTGVRASTTEIKYGSINQIHSQNKLYAIGAASIAPAYNSGYLRIIAW